MKHINLYVTGTHCPSCKILIEDILSEQSGIQNPYVNLEKKTVTFEINYDTDTKELAEILTNKMTKNGYAFLVDKPKELKKRQRSNLASAADWASFSNHFLLTPKIRSA